MPTDNTVQQPSSMSVSDFLEWEIISSYSRAQAIADGFAITSNSDRPEIRFCVDMADAREQLKRIELKCLRGPGDDAKPVLTIMLPEED